MEEEKEMLENVEHALKNFNGRAIDCIAIGEMLIKYNKLKEDNNELRKYYASRKEVEDLKETIACLHESGKDYIHRTVIENKIKKLNDYYKKEVYPIRYNWADIDITEFYDSQIELLQELLEERNK